MIKAVGAFLVVAAFLGVRGAAREAALPFDGLDRLIQPRVARFESAPDSPIETPPLSEITVESSSESEVETGNMSELIDRTPDKSTWDSWRSQTIAALPAELRANSDYRQAIDAYYFSSIGTAEDEVTVDIINRPPGGEYDIGGVGFTDIDERADGALGAEVGPGFVTREQARREVYDLRAQSDKPDAWTAFWMDWKTQAIETLPETLRNDPNYLKVIDTTYEQMMRLAPAP